MELTKENEVVVFIPLKGGGVVEIDFEDLDKETRYGRIRDYEWRLNAKGYPYTHRRVGDKSEIVFLHNMVLDRVTQRFHEAHHVNKNKLDATKKNLGVIRKSSHKALHNASTNIGVFQHDKNGYWYIRFRVNGVRMNFGSGGPNLRLARLMADKQLLIHIGREAILNFPELTDQERDLEIQKERRSIYE